MGVVSNITLSKFPKQGKFLNKRVKVCFHYDTQNVIGGVIVRDDVEAPGIEIIKLDDGRHVLSTECMYSYENSKNQKQ